MSLILSKPIYPCDPVWTLEKLGEALRIDLAELQAVAAVANRSYTKKLVKKDREVFSARPRLKLIQSRIKTAFLQRVIFPEYLTGSLRGCDYVTNAKMHTNARILICEDVQQFFPSVGSEKVKDIWLNFFGFSDAVAELLTKLTTKAGALPQGASTSSYLANLVLWRTEPLLQAKLADHGITYSRYVDDMSISSKFQLEPAELERIIADVYGMLRRNGLSAKRKKHEIFRESQRMIVTKVIVNTKASLPKDHRSAIRTQVHVLESRIAAGENSIELSKFLDQTSHKVGQLGRFHKNDYRDLLPRVRAAREALRINPPPFITGDNERWPEAVPPHAPWELRSI